MADEDPPWDPNNVTDPTSPFYAPPHYPRFKSPGPEEMPPDTAPGACPHCGTAWLSGKGRHAADGDAGVCATCCGLCIATGTGNWRLATYDEAMAWDHDPRVIAMRGIWGKPSPG